MKLVTKWSKFISLQKFIFSTYLPFSASHFPLFYIVNERNSVQVTLFVHPLYCSILTSSNFCLFLKLKEVLKVQYFHLMFKLKFVCDWIRNKTDISFQDRRKRKVTRGENKLVNLKRYKFSLFGCWYHYYIWSKSCFIELDTFFINQHLCSYLYVWQKRKKMLLERKD